MAIHLYKIFTPSTRNGARDSQIKSNPRNNLIYGQHRVIKVVMLEESLPQDIEGEIISIYTVRSIFDGMKKTYKIES